MKTYVIIDGYNFINRQEWDNAKDIPTDKIRIVLVHNYIEEILTNELSLKNYLQEARLGIDYLIR